MLSFILFKMEVSNKKLTRNELISKDYAININSEHDWVFINNVLGYKISEKFFGDGFYKTKKRTFDFQLNEREERVNIIDIDNTKFVYGYILKDIQYNEIALELSGCKGCGWIKNSEYHITMGSKAVENLIKANALEMYFEPVYKHIVFVGGSNKLLTHVDFDCDYVYIGAAKFDRNFFHRLADGSYLESDNDAVIVNGVTVTIKTIKEAVRIIEALNI